MNQHELLHELRDNILRDAGCDDRLWEDETLLRYMNEGYARFVREAKLLHIKDVPSQTQLTLTAGQTDYPLPPIVRKVKSARVAGAQYDLPYYDHREAERLARSGAGPPGYWTADEAWKVISFSPAPSALEQGVQVNLRVLRTVLEQFVIGANVIPEIPEEYHLSICDWAAYRALGTHDVDGAAPAHAKRRLAAFNMAISECAREKRHQMWHRSPRVRFGDGAWP